MVKGFQGRMRFRGIPPHDSSPLSQNGILNGYKHPPAFIQRLSKDLSTQMFLRNLISRFSNCIFLRLTA
jgi:hypothetical protein